MFSPATPCRTPDHASRNDHERKVRDPIPLRFPTEAALRRAFRADVHFLHAQGYGTANEFRQLREEHTASVRRERATNQRIRT